MRPSGLVIAALAGVLAIAGCQPVGDLVRGGEPGDDQLKAELAGMQVNDATVIKSWRGDKLSFYLFNGPSGYGWLAWRRGVGSAGAEVHREPLVGGAVLDVFGGQSSTNGVEVIEPRFIGAIVVDPRITKAEATYADGTSIQLDTKGTTSVVDAPSGLGWDVGLDGWRLLDDSGNAIVTGKSPGSGGGSPAP